MINVVSNIKLSLLPLAWLCLDVVWEGWDIVPVGAGRVVGGGVVAVGGVGDAGAANLNKEYVDKDI